jgi:hypothetical protein
MCGFCVDVFMYLLAVNPDSPHSVLVLFWFSLCMRHVFRVFKDTLRHTSMTLD